MFKLLKCDTSSRNIKITHSVVSTLKITYPKSFLNSIAPQFNNSLIFKQIKTQNIKLLNFIYEILKKVEQTKNDPSTFHFQSNLEHNLQNI